MQVLVRDNNIDQALRVLKKKMQREGVFREMKQRKSYEKPSERKNREKSEAIRRARKLARKKAQREGLIADPKKKLLEAKKALGQAATGGAGTVAAWVGGGGGGRGVRSNREDAVSSQAVENAAGDLVDRLAHRFGPSVVQHVAHARQHDQLAARQHRGDRLGMNMRRHCLVDDRR